MPPRQRKPIQAAPPARTIVNEADRPIFDPGDPYWADVPIVRREETQEELARRFGEHFATLVRRDDLPELTVVSGPAETLASRSKRDRNLLYLTAEPGASYGLLVNRHIDDVMPVLVKPGERPLDVRVTWEDNPSGMLAWLRSTPITVFEYQAKVLRHAQAVNQALRAGYETIQVDPDKFIFGLPNG